MRATLRNVRHQVPALALAGVASLSLFSCMEEALPTSGYLQEQVNKSPKAKAGAFWAIPARMYILGSSHTNFGWGKILVERDLMTGDFLFPSGEGRYNNWTSFATTNYLGQDYASTEYPFNTFYNVILAANICIKGYTASDPAQLKNADQGLLGAAYAFRAMTYLDAARMFEFLPNDIFPDGRNAQGNVVTNLTVPIVTDKLSQEASYNNPRATHQQMSDFILSDLDQAEKYIGKLEETSKDLPHLGVVYGLKARLYMWNEDYSKAAEYARKAIDLGYTPLTPQEWLNTETGFNTPTNAWMMSSTLNAETLGGSKLTNWTAHMSPEATYGYAGAGNVPPIIDKSLYDKIADTDFRKLSYKAPQGHALYGKTPYIHARWGARLDDYTCVKFRPGSGELQNFKIGSVASYPLMRVEEMYFIEAEAKAHTNPAEGLALLNTFMTKHRDKNYNCTITATDALVQEIVLQKRIELWGEGQSYFDIKRLNMPVTRAYEGTNWPEAMCYNTTTRPAWMNFVLTKMEGAFNTAVEHYNNPDPSNKYNVATK